MTSTAAASPDDRADVTAAPPGGDVPGGRPDIASGPTRQQRFEESRLGKMVISGVILVILGAQAVSSMPDSALRKTLMPIVEPAHAIGVNERWTMYAPGVSNRIEEFQVDVTMADGSIRTWKRLPNSRLEKIFLPDRWELMTATALRQQDGRMNFARWVVGQLSAPGERAVKVVMLFRFRVVAPPGEPTTGAIGTKVLYEERLSVQR